MAGTCTFNVGEVRKLLEHSKAAEIHLASLSDLFNPECHKDGIILMENGERYVEGADGHWPSSKNLDDSKIAACLWLVGDTGIYLMSNGTPQLLVTEGKSQNVVAYAAESNPKTAPDDCWDAKQRIYGGDDGSEPLPLAMFERAMKLPDEATFKIKITSRQISVIG